MAAKKKEPISRLKKPKLNGRPNNTESTPPNTRRSTRNCSNLIHATNKKITNGKLKSHSANENKETAKKSGKLKSRAIESVQLDEPTKDVNQQPKTRRSLRNKTSSSIKRGQIHTPLDTMRENSSESLPTKRVSSRLKSQQPDETEISQQNLHSSEVENCPEKQEVDKDLSQSDEVLNVEKEPLMPIELETTNDSEEVQIEKTVPHEKMPRRPHIIRESLNLNLEQTTETSDETQTSIKLVLHDRSNDTKVSVTKCIKEEILVLEEKPDGFAKNSMFLEPLETPSTSNPQKISMKKRKDYRSIEDCEILCDVDLVTQNYKAQRCKCPPEIACGDTSCWNRATSYECPSKCAHGALCKNRRFQNREYSKVECFQTDYKGRGLRALEPIAKNAFIIEYLGQIVDHDEFTRRSDKYARKKYPHYYFMTLTSNTYIDATKCGNLARFINHSCDPNAATEKWTVDRRTRIGFFALRDIQAGEEIVFDYKFERFGKTAQKCYCGASNCRGIICESGQEGTLIPHIPEKTDVNDNCSSSDESDIESLPSEPVYKKSKSAEVIESPNTPKSNADQTDKRQKFGLLNYRIPKKSDVNQQSSVTIPPVQIEQTNNNDKTSDVPVTNRRKSRFEPISSLSNNSAALLPPKLIQIPVHTSNTPCSNTCSSSSTPSYSENNNNPVGQITTQSNRSKPVYHAFAGMNCGQTFSPLPSYTVPPTCYPPMIPNMYGMPFFPAINMEAGPFMMPSFTDALMHYSVVPPPPPDEPTKD